MTSAKRIFAKIEDGATTQSRQEYPEAPASALTTHHTDFGAPAAVLGLEIAGRPAPDSVAYLVSRYNEEMRAGEKAQATQAKIAHFELAYRYALRVRDCRANMQV